MVAERADVLTASERSKQEKKHCGNHALLIGKQAMSRTPKPFATST